MGWNGLRNLPRGGWIIDGSCLSDLQRETGTREGPQLKHQELFEQSGGTVYVLVSRMYSRLSKYIFFTHSLDIYFLCAYYVPSSVLGTEDTTGKQTDKNSCPHRGCIQVEKER